MSDLVVIVYAKPEPAVMNVCRLLLATVIALDLSACVESRTPLVTQAQPAVGQQFELNLYEGFKDGRAQDFHTAVYQWKDGRYVRSGGLARDVKSLVAEPLGRDDLILQGANESESNFNYWIARRLFPGVYLIFPIVEADVDDATRNAICQSDSENTCTIKAHDQLVMLAQATAAKPLRNPALGVVMQK
jgi:hypothetical protein